MNIIEKNIRKPVATQISLLLVGICLVYTFGSAEMRRTFRNKEGQEIEAEILRLGSGNLLEIRRLSDGRVFNIPIIELSLEDQQYLSENLKELVSLGMEASIVSFEEREIELGSAAPGRLKIVGDGGFPLIVAKDDEAFVMGAASIVGKGRATVFSHSQFCDEMVERDSGVEHLFFNALKWVSGKRNPRVMLRGAPKLEAILERKDFPLVAMDFTDGSLSRCDVVILIGNLALADSELLVVRQFLANGGGLILATVPWASAGKYSNFDQDFPGNLLLSTGDVSFLPKGSVIGGTAMIVGGNPIVVDAEIE